MPQIRPRQCSFGSCRKSSASVLRARHPRGGAALQTRACCRRRASSTPPTACARRRPRRSCTRPRPSCADRSAAAAAREGPHSRPRPLSEGAPFLRGARTGACGRRVPPHLLPFAHPPLHPPNGRHAHSPSPPPPSPSPPPPPPCRVCLGWRQTHSAVAQPPPTRVWPRPFPAVWSARRADPLQCTASPKRPRTWSARGSRKPAPWKPRQDTLADPGIRPQSGPWPCFLEGGPSPQRLRAIPSPSAPAWAGRPRRRCRHRPSLLAVDELGDPWAPARSRRGAVGRRRRPARAPPPFPCAYLEFFVAHTTQDARLGYGLGRATG